MLSTGSKTCCAASADASSNPDTPVMDESEALRVIFPPPTQEDYLTLAFDEIRQYLATSVQVMRRLRSALFDLAEAVPADEQRLAVQRYLEHLNLLVERHITNVQDHLMAMQEDRQGLGLSRTRKVPDVKGSKQMGVRNDLRH